jgi:hypothetical protein
MKFFMSNPCGHPHCQDLFCNGCPHFKPYFYKIRVPKWLGHLLYHIEEYRNLKRWDKEHPNDTHGDGEF